MPRPNIFSDAQLKFMRHAYMRMMVQPADLVIMLNKKFGTDYTITQVHRAINSRKWSTRRKLILEKAEKIEEVSDTRIARQLANKHNEVMSEFAEKSVGGVRKALDFVSRADNPRSLQSAAAAAKSLFSMFKLSAGIDNATTHQGAATFNFNFASTPIPKAVVPVETVSVDPVSLPVEDGLDDDEDDEEEI